MFSRDAKDEIAAVRFERRCCATTFITALAAFSGMADARDRTCVVSTDRAAVARAALRAARLSGLRVHVKTAENRRFGRNAIEVVSDAPLAGSVRLPARGCCRRAWLRAAFLACGSVTDPNRGYHLEFNCRSDDGARALARGLAQLRIDAGVTRRRGHALIYVKGAQALGELLGHLRAARAVLALDDVIARRITKNALRRRVNSEAANAARAATSSARQRDAALRVVRGRGLERLSIPLREAARLRVAHPEYSLAELAALARPPVSKAAMAYRLREVERRASSRSHA